MTLLADKVTLQSCDRRTPGFRSSSIRIITRALGFLLSRLRPLSTTGRVQAELRSIRSELILQGEELGRCLHGLSVTASDTGTDMLDWDSFGQVSQVLAALCNTLLLKNISS